MLPMDLFVYNWVDKGGETAFSSEFAASHVEIVEIACKES